MRGFPNKLIYPDTLDTRAQKLEHPGRLYDVERPAKLCLIDIFYYFLFWQFRFLFIDPFVAIESCHNYHSLELLWREVETSSFIKKS